MNYYEFLLNKLRAMQAQGYSRQKLLDEWRTGSPDVLLYLNQSRTIAVLKGDKSEVQNIARQINHIKALDKTIANGLLEHLGVK